MGLPNINIIFRKKAQSFLSRGVTGIVAVIVRDSTPVSPVLIQEAASVPTALSADNKAYVLRALLGYVSPPKGVMLYVLPADNTDIGAALAYLSTQQFDYLCLPPDCSTEDCTAATAWLKAQRENGRIYCAVLPDTAADSEAVVNFTAEDIDIGAAEKLTAKEYCSRIAGLIVGTPLNISCTYAPLPEVLDIKRLTKQQADAAVDSGKFILIHDGEKVKVGRGVNSMTTVPADKADSMKKIKIARTVDIINADLGALCADHYIGKVANSYNNKLILLTAIQSYFATLEADSVLEAGQSTADIDIAGNEAYLKSIGVDTSKLTAQQIKEANTQDKVFLAATISILDAMEDITLKITM